MPQQGCLNLSDAFQSIVIEGKLARQAIYNLHKQVFTWQHANFLPASNEHAFWVWNFNFRQFMSHSFSCTISSHPVASARMFIWWAQIFTLLAAWCCYSLLCHAFFSVLFPKDAFFALWLQQALGLQDLMQWRPSAVQLFMYRFKVHCVIFAASSSWCGT